MAKLGIFSFNKKKNGIVELKKLQKGLLLGRRWSTSESTSVPEDVKEGHFAVIAEYGEEPSRRFVVPLGYLTRAKFLKLLENAAEEYGFNHEGALPIPCQPSELETILDDDRGDFSTVSLNWGSSEAMVLKNQKGGVFDRLMSGSLQSCAYPFLFSAGSVPLWQNDTIWRHKKLSFFNTSSCNLHC